MVTLVREGVSSVNEFKLLVYVSITVADSNRIIIIFIILSTRKEQSLYTIFTTNRTRQVRVLLGYGLACHVPFFNP